MQLFPKVKGAYIIGCLKLTKFEKYLKYAIE